MSIIEQVKELRAYSNASLYAREDKAKELLREAADTIESLSTKLQVANEELERWHTDRINEKIKIRSHILLPSSAITATTKTNIEELEAEIEELQSADVGHSAGCGGWIPCKRGCRIILIPF